MGPVFKIQICFRNCSFKNVDEAEQIFFVCAKSTNRFIPFLTFQTVQNRLKVIDRLPHTFDKMKSNLREVKARDGKIIGIVPESWDASLCDEVITVPETLDELAPILTTIATQLLAYEIALERGCEIDQPRNLAKSVTVE